MRKTFLTESLARLLRGAIGIACLAAACVSCETHSNSDRSESIAVYADPIEKKPVDAVYVGVQGGQAKIYAEANVDFVASWEDDADMPWAAVLDDTAVDPLTGCRIVTLDVQRRVETGCYYTRRTGMLILAATDGTLNYNRIVPVHQGSTARVSNDFSSMKYGKTDPRFTDDETPIDDWTTAQKDYGFSSTTIDGEEPRPLLRQERLSEIGRRRRTRRRPDFALHQHAAQRLDAHGLVPRCGVYRLLHRSQGRQQNQGRGTRRGRNRRFRRHGQDLDRARSRLLRPPERRVPREHVGGKRPCWSSWSERSSIRLRSTRASASAAARSHRRRRSTTASSSTISTSAASKRTKRITLPKTTAAART